MIDLRVVSTEVHDKAWLGRQPAGTVAPYVSPRGVDSGTDILSLARGAGRRGNDCLLVTSPSEKEGLPGFWVLRGKSTGRGQVGNLSTNDGYFAFGQRVNRLSFWVRFDEGFRATSSAASKQNLHVGTYHFDPRRKGVRKESDNWHFYHMLQLRHDLASGRWIHVVLNDIPQHIRSRSLYHPAPNPTQPAGNYWELLTRFYVDCTPYFAPAEIPHPVRMWVDDISLDYAPEYRDVSVQIKPPASPIVTGQTTTLQVEVYNGLQQQVTGQIGHRSYYTWTPNLVDSRTGKSAHKATVTLYPGANYFDLMVTPRSTMKRGDTLVHAVVFVPKTQLTQGSVSHADPAVRLDAYFGVGGPCDSTVASDQITLTIG